MDTESALDLPFAFSPPMTKHIAGQPLRCLQDSIKKVLTHLHVAFFVKSPCHFSAGAWFPLVGWSTFAIHIWRRDSTSSAFAVEVGHELGDSGLTGTMFTHISKFLDDPHRAMPVFEERVLVRKEDPAAIRAPVTSKIAEYALLRMISSMSDKVAGQGCTAVGKVAASCSLFLHALSSASFPRAIVKVAFRLTFSWESRTSAMMALAVFSTLPLSVSVLHGMHGSVYACVTAFADSMASARAEDVVGQFYNYYTLTVLINIIAVLSFDVETSAFLCSLFSTHLESSYAPLKMLAARGLEVAKL